MATYIQSLRKMHNLAEDASPEDVEMTAKVLLSAVDTKMYGAELVLNRRIDSSESGIVRLFAFTDVNTAYGLLLLQKALEQEYPQITGNR